MMIRNFIVIVCCTLIGFSGAMAQTTDDLVAYYTFNDSTANDQTGAGGNGQIITDVSFICGVEGIGVAVEGGQQIIFAGLIENYFENDDLTFSFFFHVDDPVGSTQTIFSKSNDCSANNAFFIKFNPSTNSVIAILSENDNKRVDFSAVLDVEKCWQHVAIVRESATVRFYLNGELQGTPQTTISRIDLESAGVLTFGTGQCVGVTDDPFNGRIDELRIYDRALDEDEVRELYFPLEPDNIVTRDTTVFLGNDVQLELGNTCANSVDWTPVDFLDDPLAFEPLVSPEDSRVYYASFNNIEIGCTAVDSVRISVIDPADLDCTQAFLPNAFTPNGDGRNDTFGISNPYAIPELTSFEIFDRWGGRVFMTTDPFDRWDGDFKNQPMNPGVLLYRVVHQCNGEEIVNVGSLTIIR